MSDYQEELKVLKGVNELVAELEDLRAENERLKSELAYAKARLIELGDF